MLKSKENAAEECLVSAAERLCINECNVKKNLGEESTVYVNEGIEVESIEEYAVSGAETESFKSATQELCNVKKNLGEESTVYVNEGIEVESIEEYAVSGAETESFKSATQELDYNADSFVTAGDAEGNSCTSSMRRDNDGWSQYDHNTNLADIGKPRFICAASSATLPVTSLEFRGDHSSEFITAWSSGKQLCDLHSRFTSRT
ncbi:hypothetical protein F511_26866 [Dorcoceras hygrometricum]|uniref:Uncharacterized protein n=1 Tax=Dorcoceras hygrometricum TaxID=472368 RepID=A0A2Z7C9K9_9LAMI|nr:hypothetical protein F511_26866 [Dorcoceras hygrometricum]